MMSNKKLADQVLPKPGTNNIGEYEGQQNVGKKLAPYMTLELSQTVVFIYPFVRSFLIACS